MISKILLRNLPADKAGIRQKLLEENTGGSYLKYSIGVILESEIGNNCPFRDLIWVEQSISQGTTVPLGLPVPQAGTGYVGNPTIGTFHIAYLPTGQAGLRHAIFVFRSVFYLYILSLRDIRESKSSFKALKPQFLC
jgi:hypothetical protein